MPLFGQNPFDQDVGKFDSVVLYRSECDPDRADFYSHTHRSLRGFPCSLIVYF